MELALSLFNISFLNSQTLINNSNSTFEWIVRSHSLRKHAHSNMKEISPPKAENSQIKKLIFFYISAQSIDCGYSLEPPRRGGSNENSQSMFMSRN